MPAYRDVNELREALYLRLSADDWRAVHGDFVAAGGASGNSLFDEHRALLEAGGRLDDCEVPL